MRLPSENLLGFLEVSCRKVGCRLAMGVSHSLTTLQPPEIHPSYRISVSRILWLQHLLIQVNRPWLWFLECACLSRFWTVYPVISVLWCVQGEWLNFCFSTMFFSKDTGLVKSTFPVVSTRNGLFWYYYLLIITLFLYKHLIFPHPVFGVITSKLLTHQS